MSKKCEEAKNTDKAYIKMENKRKTIKNNSVEIKRKIRQSKCTQRLKAGKKQAKEEEGFVIIFKN